MSADLRQGCLGIGCLGYGLDFGDAERDGQRGGMRWVTASGLAGGANCVEDGQRVEPATGRVKREIVNVCAQVTAELDLAISLACCLRFCRA